MENCDETKKSIQSSEKDVFGNSTPFNDDHVWPESLDGTNAKINKLKLSVDSNKEKKDKTKGTINKIKFSILKQTTKKNKNGEQTVYGIMYIKIDDVCYTVIK